MATNTSIQVLARNVRSVDVGEYSIDAKPVLPVVAAAGDSITLFTAPHDIRMNTAHLRQAAGGGAGVTLKLQRNRAGVRTDLTATTTANTAGVVSSATVGPQDILAGDTVEVLVAGGVNAAIGIEYDLLCRRA
jgi:hypothetical protein